MALLRLCQDAAWQDGVLKGGPSLRAVGTKVTDFFLGAAVLGKLALTGRPRTQGWRI